jgi:hypothetical protein
LFKRYPTYKNLLKLTYWGGYNPLLPIIKHFMFKDTTRLVKGRKQLLYDVADKKRREDWYEEF